jgi:HK97 family phage prohead protease
MHRAVLPTRLRQVGNRQVRAIISSGLVGRDKLLVDVAGIDLAGYRRNPVVLWNHQPDAPVGRVAPITRNGSGLEGTITFAPEGVSDTADQVYGLVKSGVVNSVSIGFEPGETTRPDRDGTRTIRNCELLEVSFVSLPADTGAVVIERAMGRGRRSPWYLAGSAAKADLGHRLLALEGLRPKAYRMAAANAIRFGPDAAPAFAGGSIQRARNERDREAARRAHQEAVTAAAIARNPGVPMVRAARLRELAELRGK